MKSKKEIYMEKANKILIEVAAVYDMAYESGLLDGLREDIIHCKDCKYQDDITYICEKHGKIFGDPFYCGYGEPKESEE